MTNIATVGNNGKFNFKYSTLLTMLILILVS